jgi:hypothetical protein
LTVLRWHHAAARVHVHVHELDLFFLSKMLNDEFATHRGITG